MKKIFSTVFLLTLIMIITDLLSNPVEVHFINEFMITENGWKLELHTYSGGGELFSLDGGYLTSSTDTAYFKEEISFYIEDYTVITNDSMQSDLDINPEGDIISIFFEENLTDRIYFGIPDPYAVPALLYGHSMNIYHYSEGGWSHIGYYLDNSPTFGFENDTINANGNIEGFIKDSLNNPIEGVKVIYGYYDVYPGFPIFVVTNSEGYFILRDLSVLKNLEFKKEGYFAPDSSVQILPDSTVTIHIQMNAVMQISTLPESPSYNFELKQNYPNPFNSATTFNYILAEGGDVEINIYDEKGEFVSNLFKKYQAKGEYKFSWNADNLASGIYFYEIKIKDQKLSKKCLLIK
ncbi:MAG: T9SS C-terminal target domain-containing protein [Ignavibacteriales bacterium]|nr:MAG: T9SS C-terminal target domain-containing protein [Ignavibacteriales bacterium]